MVILYPPPFHSNRLFSKVTTDDQQQKGKVSLELEYDEMWCGGGEWQEHRLNSIWERMGGVENGNQSFTHIGGVDECFFQATKVFIYIWLKMQI